MTTKSSADAARTRALLRRSKRRRGDRGEGCGNPCGCLTCVCCIPEPTRATSNDGHAFHSRSHPPFPSHHLHRNRDALGRKVEADVEAKTDFNALKNQWDSIEKDFHTWSKEVRREGGKKGRKEGGEKGTREGGKKKKACNTKLLKEGSALVAAAEKIIEETKHKMHLATTKRTSKDSLVEDVWEKNPTIKEE
eukprot:evm.model.NODE_30377_length_4124_cov_19.921436.1